AWCATASRNHPKPRPRRQPDGAFLLSALRLPAHPMEEAMATDADHSRAPAAGLTIRAREPDDWEAIADLMALPKVRFGTLRLPFQSRDATRKWLEKVSEGHTGIVAVLDGRIVGSAGVDQYKGRRNHVGRNGLCVQDDFHRRGIGSALLAALADL